MWPHHPPFSAAIATSASVAISPYASVATATPTPLTSTKSGVRALLLGVYDASGVLHYTGNVAPSVKASRNDAISQRIEPLKQKKEAFADAPVPDRDATMYG